MNFVGYLDGRWLRRLQLLGALLLTGCAADTSVEDPNAEMTLSEIGSTVEGSFAWGSYSSYPDEFRMSFFGRVTVAGVNGPVSFVQSMTPTEAADFAAGMTITPSSPATLGYENGRSSFRLRSVESLVLTEASTSRVTIEGILGPPMESNPEPGPSTVTMVLTSAEPPSCDADGATPAVAETAYAWTTPECSNAETTLGLTPLLDAVFGR